MTPDPFRIQLLTLSLDSQTVLTVVGLVVAAFVFRLAARRLALDLRAGHWWDLVTVSVVGARLLWVATHADYYLRQPLQVVVIVDGGLHPLGLALGAAYWVWRLGRPGDGSSWRLVADLVAVGTLTTFLFERAGCALTTCGAGSASVLPWALQRGAEWREPVALEQVVVLAVALAVSVEALRVRGAAFAMALVALALIELVALAAGSFSLEWMLVLGAALLIYVGIWSCQSSRVSRDAPRQLGPA
jgi:prolipoprotein diacylglyceryltransferase